MLSKTNALLGFYYKSKYYVSLEENNGETCQLGKIVVDELREVIQSERYEEWKQRFQQIKIVYYSDIPSDDDLENLSSYTDLEMGDKNWYGLTYHAKGSLKNILESGYLFNYVDNNSFPHFQDYAYILNLDSDMLDFYQGARVIKSYYLTDLPNW